METEDLKQHLLVQCGQQLPDFNIPPGLPIFTGKVVWDGRIENMPSLVSFLSIQRKRKENTGFLKWKIIWDFMRYQHFLFKI